MGSQRMDFPSPRGVHVPESYYAGLDPDDPYRRPSSLNRRNRYSRSSAQQTPRVRNATWISSPDQVAPQTPLAPQSPWLTPSSPAHRPPSPIPPSPVPTVGEHMTLDDLAFVPGDIVEPYPPSPPRRHGILKSFWRGFKKLSGLEPSPPFPIPRPSFYRSRTVEMPIPVPSVPSEASQYVDPTPPETSGTDEHRSASPYASPYARPASVGASPAAIPGSLRASSIRVPSMEIPPPITVISPSDPSTPLSNVTRSIRIPTPGPSQRNLSLGAQEPVIPVEEGSQTLHEPVYPDAVIPQPVSIHMPMPTPHAEHVKFPQPDNGGIRIQSPPDERGSRSSPMTRFRRFVADLDGLPWISDNQIADEYIPEKNPRSQLRARLRQGAEPSWYNPRPDVEERPAYWSEWDMWAKQSTAALWDGTLGGRAGWAGVGAGGGIGQGNEQMGPGHWGMMYPHGYAPVQPEWMYPSEYPPPGAVGDQSHSPVLP